jgi:uncharacterized membrane protein
LHGEKGTASHKLLGRTWVAVMIVVAHQGFMIGTFLGLAGAGIGAFAPGRLLATLL